MNNYLLLGRPEGTPLEALSRDELIQEYKKLQMDYDIAYREIDSLKKRNVSLQESLDRLCSKIKAIADKYNIDWRGKKNA